MLEQILANRAALAEKEALRSAGSPLTWQKLRAILAKSGALELGWRVYGKGDESDVVARIRFQGPARPSKGALSKLYKTLGSLGVKYDDAELRAKREMLVVVKSQNLRPRA